MTPGLYVLGTPIGNLGDITLRGLETLRAADLVLAEDTRRTQNLLAHHGIRVPMLSCHKFNEASRTALVLDKIRTGTTVALVTDSGMPGVSDPGARMVAACREAGFPVTVLPGPSAVTAAVALSGFHGGGFVFEGFLPRKSGARRRRLTELAGLSLAVVLFEAPYRLTRLLSELAEIFGDCKVLIARELTKKFEECLVGTPTELADRLATRSIKGEITVVIAPSRSAPEPPSADAPEESEGPS